MAVPYENLTVAQKNFVQSLATLAYGHGINEGVNSKGTWLDELLSNGAAKREGVEKQIYDALVNVVAKWAQDVPEW